MKSASPIHLLERDLFLGFQNRDPVWPPGNLRIFSQPKADEESKGSWMAGHWKREVLPDGEGGYLCRELTKKEVSLHEAVLRFPSAPLFGCQSKHGYQVHIEPIHQHTFRLLTSPRATGDIPKINKLFLLFNGLNELDYFDLYYNLASLLIGEDPGVACIIHPFPGHLTRYPLIGKYAERPLQRFVTDPSDLFRQYLRHMVEMQWLLSILVPFSFYPVAPGISLLAEHVDPGQGRCNDDTISQAIHEDWKSIFDKSQRERPGRLLEKDEVGQAVAVIRKLIGWEHCPQKLADHQGNEPLASPQIHVIGYSLGGYLAQCVFFTWPFAIGSCTTLCSGGALAELRPERIIHEEEWHAITHGLKYEIESGMIEGRLHLDETGKSPSVCGIPVPYFSSHFQIFNDIFLQDRHGSYRHRVSEFTPRMLFVVGGGDPIVTAQSILHASPRGGVNMIEIAKLSHFIATDKGEWPRFWLPTIAGIISSLSTHSEKLLREAVLSNLWNEETSDSAKGTWLPPGDINLKNELERANKDRRESQPLNADRMQRAILDLLEPVDGDGFLFILRNQIPVTLLGPRMLHRRGSIPHYEDLEIRTFWQQLQERRILMRKHHQRITLVVPGRLNNWFTQEPTILSVKNLLAAREVPPVKGLKDIWEDFLTDWEGQVGALHRFDPENPKEIDNGPSSPFRLERMIREITGTPSTHCVLNCLPDVWFSLSKGAVTAIAGAWANRERLHECFIELMSLVYAHGKTLKDTDSKRTTEAYDNVCIWLENRSLRIIRVSAAQSNPQFLGEQIWDTQVAIDLLVHSALALARSTPCGQKGDFQKDWPPAQASPEPRT